MKVETTRPYRMTTRRDAVQRTRRQILNAAYRQFLDHPYDDVTLDVVASDAGVTRQTVLRHFGSKEGLLLAATDEFGPREEAARESVAPGDIEGAVRMLVERYEIGGDANVRFLDLEGRIEAVDHLLAKGREGHRRWIEHVFGPRLPRKGPPRERAIRALYAATDVTVWKLLRRDLDTPADETGEIIRTLVEGALSLPAQKKGGSR